MDFTISEGQEELRRSVREMLAHECPTSVVRTFVESGEPPRELWKRMIELGWPAFTIPEDDGGLGLPFVDLVLAIEELGRAMTPGPLLPTLTQFAPAVREAGNREQRKRFLGAIARGELTGTLAVAEESASWRAEEVRATARRRGAGWVLQGTKRFVVEGASADEIVVAARARDGLRLFIVPTGSVRAIPIRSLDASREVATIVLEGVRVGPDRALGDPDRCARALERAVEEATVALAMEIVGACQAIFDRTLEYAKTREQFDAPIGSFQAIKHKFANMLIVLEKARAAAYFAAMTIAEDDPRRSIAAATAKAAAGDCQRLIAKEGIQIHGGIGFTWEHDIHLFVKRAKAGDALFGTGGTHRLRVASLLGI